MTIKKWIAGEVKVAFDRHLIVWCPPGMEIGFDCDGCPYTSVFGPFETEIGKRAPCSRFRPRSEEHKTAACFLAAIYDVEL